MNTSAAAKRGFLGFLAVLLLLLLSGATIVLHDYLCHDHLHELCSPLHSTFDSPERFEPGAFLGQPPPIARLVSSNEKIHRHDLVKNIFHPPDFLS